MFFYASLFVASVIVSLVLVWLYRSLAGVGKAVYQAILPSNKDSRDPTRHLETTTKLNTTINEVPQPWGWEGTADLYDSKLDSTRIKKLRKNLHKGPSNKPWGW